jgi:hypothetical protein
MSERIRTFLSQWTTAERAGDAETLTTQTMMQSARASQWP